MRVVHWGLVAAFGIAYFTEDDMMDVHVAAGYTVLALVLCRIVWGFIGGPYARFSSFVSGPRVVMAYLRDLASLRARRNLGHNPAGGAMIILLLVALLVGATVSGLAVYAADEQAGPLAFWLGGIGEAWEDRLEEWHDLLADLTAVLVLLHFLGVLVESIMHKENPVGRPKGRPAPLPFGNPIAKAIDKNVSQLDATEIRQYLL